MLFSSYTWVTGREPLTYYDMNLRLKPERVAIAAASSSNTTVHSMKHNTLMKEFPLLSMFNIHENLLESLLELQNYADVQAVLAKYDGEFTCTRHTRRYPRPCLA
ncbi:hypothetical protein GOODEAATRI_019427 [Goodea atripinnis]|uniref:Uncharacterized protein n=1 Tax=Goodea atripinnis TaxID=208336 RepID=A0ABV0PQM2_9TELE